MNRNAPVATVADPLMNQRRAEFVTGDPEFQAVKKDLTIQ